MAVADFQHVRIIPVPWTSKFLQTILSKPNQRHAFVAVADVTRGPPQIAGLRSPAPRCFHAPVANAEHDGAAGLRQRITEFRVLHLGVETLRIAPVDLHVIDSPRGIRFGVLHFVVQTAWPLFAGAGACVGVDPQFQTLTVHIVSERLDAGGKSFWIGDNSSMCITTHLTAVVYFHILIYSCLYPDTVHICDHFVHVY